MADSQIHWFPVLIVLPIVLLSLLELLLHFALGLNFQIQVFTLLFHSSVYNTSNSLYSVKSASTSFKALWTSSQSFILNINTVLIIPLQEHLIQDTDCYCLSPAQLQEPPVTCLDLLLLFPSGILCHLWIY